MFESEWYDIAVNIATIAFILVVFVDIVYIAIHNSKSSKNNKKRRSIKH